MKAIFKKDYCPTDNSHLVAIDGVLTCEDECEFNPEMKWHPETEARIRPILDWQESLR